MSTFTINPYSDPAARVRVTLADGIQLDGQGLLAFGAFKGWLDRLVHNLSLQYYSGHTFSSDPWHLDEIKIQDLTRFGTNRMGFMSVEAVLRRDPSIQRDAKSPTELNRVVFLRGGSVAILMILRPKDAKHERYVIMTEQPRIGSCGMSFLEIPAGMMDESNNINSKAIKEIKACTGFTIQPEELIDMTILALGESGGQDSEHVKSAMYPSCANLDEYISLLLWEKELDRKEIEALRAKLTGLTVRDELITPRLLPYEDLWRQGARDAKSLGAWALYEGLNRSGEIEDKLRKIRMGKFETSAYS